MNTLHLVLLAGSALLLLAVNSVFGCMCADEHPQTSVCKADFVVRGDILKKQIISVDGFIPYEEIMYTVKVKRIYKGEEFMPEEGAKIVHIFTEAGMCSGGLEKGTRYLITATYSDQGVQKPQLRTSLCNWNVEWSQITQAQRQGLKHFYTRYCQKCEITQASVGNGQFIFPLNGNRIAPAKPTKCVYDYDGGECEKLHASCIRKQSGACDWTTNTNLRACRLQIGETR